MTSFYCDKEQDDQKQLVKEAVYFTLQLLDHSLTEESESRSQGRNLESVTREEGVEE